MISPIPSTQEILAYLYYKYPKPSISKFYGELQNVFSIVQVRHLLSLENKGLILLYQMNKCAKPYTVSLKEELDYDPRGFYDVWVRDLEFRDLYFIFPEDQIPDFGSWVYIDVLNYEIHHYHSQFIVGKPCAFFNSALRLLAITRPNNKLGYLYSEPNTRIPDYLLDKVKLARQNPNTPDFFKTETYYPKET